MADVYITRTSSFLPNEPVSNDEIESFLGLIGEEASKSKRIVLRNNGIKNRYYAIDKSGNATHSNAEMVALAIKSLFNNSEEIEQIELISCGTSTPDQLMPSHAVMVHGYLPESRNIEVVSPSGVCCSGMHAFKYGFMALKLGLVQKAVCTGSERLSRLLHADQFEVEHQKMQDLEENPIIAFEKDFLRFMLSDGAGCFLLESEKSTDGHSLKVEWIECFSFANEADVCMYMGSDKDDQGKLKSFQDFSPEEIAGGSIMSIKQDVKILGENIVPLGFSRMSTLLLEKGIKGEDIDFFLPHMSSYYFQDKIQKALADCGLDIPGEKWFTNLDTIGNVGAGSIYLMVDELMKSGRLHIGDKILLAVPESARFSYVVALLEVC